MQPLSVVIVCRNAEKVIGKTLRSLEGLSDDIIVYDSGSTDGTQQQAIRFNVRIFNGSWDGFGPTKQKAISLARHDWILSLDADEAIDEELKKNILGLTLSDKARIYDLAFKNYFGRKHLKFGEWGHDHHYRIFNRQEVGWNDALVHEQLVTASPLVCQKLKGYVLHFTAEDVHLYRIKLLRYAQLCAEKYHRAGKKPPIWKKWVSPLFSFVQNFIFRLGFLDGVAGFRCALLNAGYTFNKYDHLNALWKNDRLSLPALRKYDSHRNAKSTFTNS